MGSGSWSTDSWSTYSSKNIDTKRSVSGSSGIYSSTKMDNELNPKDVKFRESCDSVEHPNSSPIIVALDVTGSMGSVLESIARKGLNTLITEVYNRKPIKDPHIMFMGIGDVEYDSQPLQVTQFEADIRIAEQLQKIYFERGGGGNDSESYTLPWYFANYHTKIDSYSKRGQKGLLFTIGDECPPKKIGKDKITEFIGDEMQSDFTTEELLNSVAREWEVFHLIIEEGSFCRRNKDRVVKEWTDLLGQNAIIVSDHTKIAEIIVSILQRINGEEVENIVSSWDGNTSIAVNKAIQGLDLTKKNKDIIEF